MTRGVVSDLTLKRFGNLLVLRRNKSDAQGNACWSCKCDCGNEVSIRGVFLKRGQAYCSKQCPIYQEGIRCDIRGKIFGRLTAREMISIATNGAKTIWRFECSCGKETICDLSNVLSGNTASCGCLGIESRIKHGLSQTRDYHRDAHRKWAHKNPGKVIENAYRRKSDFSLRVPAWLTDDDRDKIQDFYRKSAEISLLTGIKHHVDHIIPLRGKKVSGLHVPTNLQVISARENLTKSSSFFDDVC